MKKLYHTNYSVAVNWCNNALVLCNNIPEIDDSVWDNFEPVPDLGYEPKYDKNGEEIILKCLECGEELEWVGHNWQCPECDYGHIDPDDIFQWFITDCSESDMEYLRDTFGLLFTYSNLLDCYILCVTHFGTGWDYVDWQTTNPYAERQCGEKK